MGRRFGTSGVFLGVEVNCIDESRSRIETRLRDKERI